MSTKSGPQARDFSRGSRAVGAANCRCGSGCSGVLRYRSTRKSVYSAKYHVTWCPKYRQRVIGGRVEARLKQIIDEAVTEWRRRDRVRDHARPRAPVAGAAADSPVVRADAEDEGPLVPAAVGGVSAAAPAHPRRGHPHGSSRRLVEPRSTLPAATSRTSSWSGSPMSLRYRAYPTDGQL